MTFNISKNQFCPCNSGLKYKNCCMDKGTNNQNIFKHLRWLKVQKQLIPKIMDHISCFYGPYAIDEAYETFMFFKTDQNFDPETEQLPIFLPWFYYEWSPDDDSSIFEANLDEDNELINTLLCMPPALSLATIGADLSLEEKNYLVACCESSFSFFEVTEVVEDTSLRLNNILTEESHFVLEKKGTKNVQIGDIFFGKIVCIDGLEILETTAPIIINPYFKAEIINLRQAMHEDFEIIDNEALHEYSFDILETYHEIFDNITRP